MNNTDIAKKAVHMIVALYTAQMARDEISEHTDVDYDSIPLQVGCFVGGHLVANQTDKVTGPAIERTAAWLSTKKFSIRKNKKETTSDAE
jgi:hypothetical protein